MSDEKIILRDFIYLDWERIRSIAAQLFKGVPLDATAERGNEIVTKGEIGGNAFGVLKGQVGADYRFFRTENETRSLHHHIYSLVENELSQKKLLTQIDKNFSFDKWQENYFRDGQFVHVRGSVRLMDYSWMSTMLEALPKMMKTAHHCENISLKHKKDAQVISQGELNAKQKEQQKQISEINNLKINEMTSLIKQLYGDTVRIKIVPSKDRAEYVFVGSGEIENFHDTASSLSQKYGYEIDADWATLGQINFIKAQQNVVPIPTGNEMEDAFEQVALAVNDVIQVASGVSFPAVSFTPLSIYRLC